MLQHRNLRTGISLAEWCEMTERMFKVLVIGDSNVGKTAFVNQYVNGHYKGVTKQTFGGRKSIQEGDSTKFLVHAFVAWTLQLRLL